MLLHACLFSHADTCLHIACSHAHLACLACMFRLHIIACISCLLNWLWQRLGPIICFVHFIPYWNCTFWLFGHHAWKCVIGGPRAKEHPPLSHEYDKEGGGANIALEMHCHALSALYCCQTGFCRKLWPAGHLQCRPAIHWWPMD